MGVTRSSALNTFAARGTIEKILLTLLSALEAIGEENEELFDSEVRQLLRNAVMDGFVRAKPKFVVPDDFGMESKSANKRIRNAIQDFVDAANREADKLQAGGFHARLALFQDQESHTDEGNDYEEFFGHCDPKWFDEKGKDRS